jgi:hypothetical protein
MFYHPDISNVYDNRRLCPFRGDLAQLDWSPWAGGSSVSEHRPSGPGATGSTPASRSIPRCCLKRRDPERVAAHYLRVGVEV